MSMIVPSEIVNRRGIVNMIFEYVSNDRDMKSPTAGCIKHIFKKMFYTAKEMDECGCIDVDEDYYDNEDIYNKYVVDHLFFLLPFARDRL